MPALNEEQYIGAAIETLLSDTGALDCELLVMDGGSTDATAAIVSAIADRDPRVRLQTNPRRLQAAAMNLGATLARPGSTVLVRADCHAVYPAGFLRHCVEELQRRQVASVVVPMITQGRSCWQRAIAAAQNSRLGNGGSAHRRLGEPRFVDHGHHAAFDRAVFMALGGYDESFSHNEDAEYDIRLGRTGHKVWLAADMPITYIPRSSLSGLARQYFRHGRGRAKTALKHRRPLKPRQMAPLIGAFGGALSLLAGLWHPVLALPAFAYIGGALAWGAADALRSGDRCRAAMGVAALTMHGAWATGFLYQILQGGGAKPPMAPLSPATT